MSEDSSPWAPRSPPAVLYEVGTTEVVSLGRGPRSGRWRKVALGIVVAAAVVAVTSLVWQARSSRGGDEEPRFLAIGTWSDYPAGSVTPLEIDEAWFDHLAFESSLTEDGDVEPRRVEGARLLVANSDHLRVFLARSPYMGCTLTADSTTVRAFAEVHGVDPSLAALTDACHGGLFALDGRHLGGPGDRGLDSFAVHVEPDGEVLIDLTDLRPGAADPVDVLP